MKKRILSLVLTLAICVTFMPTVFFQSAQEVNAEPTKTCTYSVTYKLGDNGSFINQSGDYFAEIYFRDTFLSMANRQREAIEDANYNFSISDKSFKVQMTLIRNGVERMTEDGPVVTWKDAEICLPNIPDGVVYDGNKAINTKSGYTFDGWYLGPEEDAEEYTFGSIAVGEDFAETNSKGIVLYAHYTDKDYDSNYWDYLHKNDLSISHYLFGDADSENKITYSMESFKSLNSMKELDTIIARHEGENTQTIKLLTENTTYTGNPVEATVDYSNWTAKGLKDYELKYFDFAKIQEMYYENKKDPEDEEGKVEALWRSAKLSKAPTKPGMYVAMLVSENLIDTGMSYNELKNLWLVGNDSDYALSFFAITDPDDNWTYSNKAGVKDVQINTLTGLLPTANRYMYEFIEHYSSHDFYGFNFDLIDSEDFEKKLEKIEDYDTVYAKGNNGDKHEISISVNSKKYDKEPINVEVNDEDWTADGLTKFKLRYLNYGKLQDELFNVIKAIADGWYNGDDFNPELETPLTSVVSDNLMEKTDFYYANLPEKAAPTEPGMYVAMLVPQNATETDIVKLFYDNLWYLYGSEPIGELSEEELEELEPIFQDVPAAFSFFQIKPNRELCDHVWKFSGPSGDLGDGVYEVFDEILSKYGYSDFLRFANKIMRELRVRYLNRLDGPSRILYPARREFTSADAKLIAESLYEFLNPENGFLEMLEYNGSLFTNDDYAKIAKKLNNLTNKITATCDTCDKTEYIEMVVPTKAGQPVTFDKTHWTDEELQNKEFKTYYINLDNIANTIDKSLRAIQGDVITPINDLMKIFKDGSLKDLEALGDDPFVKLLIDYMGFDGTEGIDDLANMNEVIKIAVTVLDDVADELLTELDTVDTDVPTEPGKYVAITRFVNEDGSVVKTDDFIKQLKKLINWTETDFENNIWTFLYGGYGMTWTPDMQNLLDSLGSTIQSLYQGGMVFYSIDGTTSLDKTVAQNVKTKIDKLNKLSTTYSSKDVAAVKAAKNAYNQLSDKQKTLLKLSGHYKALTTAQQKISFMSKTAKTPKVTAKKGKNVVKWSKTSGAEKYRVYRATKKSGKYYYRYQTTKTTYNNTAVKKGKRYYYKVRAAKKIGNQIVYTKPSSAKSAKAK